MPQTVEVRFKGNRRGFHAWSDDHSPLVVNEPVVVEAERGLDFGFVQSAGASAELKCGGCDGCGPAADSTRPAAIRQVVRRAEPDDLAHHEELRRDEDAVRLEVSRRADAQGLAMRISDAEWQWDRHRLTVYFTAERRVDFRTLVRELAGRFRARIELRQIGVRDEAARLGGIGRCGREFCCSTWLTQPGPVNLALAKDQRLSLNPIADLRGMRPTALLPQVRARVLSRVAQALPKEGKQRHDAARPREGGGGRHLPRARLAAQRGTWPPERAAGRPCVMRWQRPPRPRTGTPGPRAGRHEAPAGHPARENPDESSLLPHHRDRLFQRRSASRPRAGEDRRRRDRPLASAARANRSTS